MASSRKARSGRRPCSPATTVSATSPSCSTRTTRRSTVQSPGSPRSSPCSSTPRPSTSPPPGEHRCQRSGPKGAEKMSLQEFIPTPKFEEYAETFKDFFKLNRREDGVILAEAHTLDGPIQLSVQNHRAL